MRGSRSAPFLPTIAGGKNVDGAAAIVGALEEALGLEVADVFMDGGE
jgi:hypothetical protein